MYYAKVFKEDLGRGLEILSDILINSLLDEGAVHRERDVIIREMEEVNKQQEEVPKMLLLRVSDLLRQTFLVYFCFSCVVGGRNNGRGITQRTVRIIPSTSAFVYS